MPSLSLFAAGVIAFFGAVIFFGLRLSAQARQRALDATPIDERLLLEEKIDVAGSRRMWRMVLLERMTKVKYAIQDEQRRVLAEVSLGLGPGFSRVLRVGQKTLTVLIQSPRSAFAGKANGRASDSVVVRDEAALIFESLPWAEGTTRGTTAHTPSGLLEIVWAPVTWQLKKETCRGRPVSANDHPQPRGRRAPRGARADCGAPPLTRTKRAVAGGPSFAG